MSTTPYSTPYAAASAPPPGTGSNTASSSNSVARPGRRSGLHRLFLAVNYITFFVALNMVICQLWGVAVQSAYPIEVLVRLYTVGLSVLTMLNELSLSRFTQQSLVLQNFVCRGFLYNFVGALGIMERDIGNDNYYKGNRYNHYKYRNPTEEDFAEMYITVSSWVLFFMGLVYVLMGAFCLQAVYNRMREDYDTRLEDWKKEDEAARRAHLRGEVQEAPQSRICIA